MGNSVYNEVSKISVKSCLKNFNISTPIAQNNTNNELNNGFTTANQTNLTNRITQDVTRTNPNSDDYTESLTISLAMAR